MVGNVFSFFFSTTFLHTEENVLLINYFHPKTVEESEKSQIVKAMKDFTTQTCIRFIPRVSQRMYISIEPRFG